MYLHMYGVECKNYVKWSILYMSPCVHVHVDPIPIHDMYKCMFSSIVAYFSTMPCLLHTLYSISITSIDLTYRIGMAGRRRGHVIGVTDWLAWWISPRAMTFSYGRSLSWRGCLTNENLLSAINSCACTCTGMSVVATLKTDLHLYEDYFIGGMHIACSM